MSGTDPTSRPVEAQASARAKGTTNNDGRFAEMLRKPVLYVLMCIVIIVVDLLTGPYLMFPVLFVVPVTLCATYCSAPFAFGQAIALPLIRLAIVVFIEHPHPAPYAVLNAITRIGVLLLIAMLAHRTARQAELLKREVVVLRGILPTCMFCKKIRDERGAWNQIEAYITERSEARFSHGLCPQCAQQHYGDVLNQAPDPKPAWRRGFGPGENELKA